MAYIVYVPGQAQDRTIVEGLTLQAVAEESDPLRQAKLAGELISLYQQRSVELARLRKEAINRAAAERGISYSSIAAELGLTRGRITQIRQTAPAAERAFFAPAP